jgi:predicted metal-dependent hydrolase
MSGKKEKVSARLEKWRGHRADPHLVGYFDCFNRGLYYEAHDVLEQLWLQDRQGPDGAFYKGLIQLAGAFVHLQKNRRGPAVALFKLALANLEKYPARHLDLEVAEMRATAAKWIIHSQEYKADTNPLDSLTPPTFPVPL